MQFRSRTDPGRAASSAARSPQALIRATVKAQAVSAVSADFFRSASHQPGTTWRMRPLKSSLGRCSDPKGQLKLHGPSSISSRAFTTQKAVAEPFLLKCACALRSVPSHRARRGCREGALSDRLCPCVHQHRVDDRTQLPPLIVFTHGPTPLFTNRRQNHKVGV